MIREDLEKLSPQELQQVWMESGRTGSIPTLKRLAVREIAWSAQETSQGGLDSRTRTLLQDAKRSSQVASSQSPSKQKARKPTIRASDLEAGTKLIRKWRGQLHEVVVLAAGRFEYRGETYGSLTKIAERITSAHWSGPRFFGLDRVRGVS